MGVIHSFVWNCVKYVNMEGFCRDSYIYYKLLIVLTVSYIGAKLADIFYQLCAAQCYQLNSWCSNLWGHKISFPYRLIDVYTAIHREWQCTKAHLCITLDDRCSGSFSDCWLSLNLLNFLPFTKLSMMSTLQGISWPLSLHLTCIKISTVTETAPLNDSYNSFVFQKL